MNRDKQNYLKYMLQVCRHKNLLKSGRTNEYINDIPSAQHKLPENFIRMCPWEAEYLFRVAEMAKHNVVEIGRMMGGSTMLLAGATPNKIKSIDWATTRGADEKLNKLRSYIKDFGLTNIDLYIANSQTTNLSDGRFKYDVVFIDGDHSYEGVMADMENWWDNLEPGGHYVLHDCWAPRYEIGKAVCDFIADKDIIMHVAPIRTGKYYMHPFGSICHFQKKK